MLISRHVSRQIQFIVPGALITYYYQTPQKFLYLLHGTDKQPNAWAQISAFTCLMLGLSTGAMFIYLLLMPLIKGEQPNYQIWRESSELVTIIPILTGCIVSGWSLSTFTLGHWSSLGYLEGIVATTGFYALCSGLLGIVPVAKPRRI